MQTIIKNPPLPWYPGDERVEPFMAPVLDELHKHGLSREIRTSIYNRAYEAVESAVRKYASPSPDGAQREPATKTPERLCSMEDARLIWECAIEAAQDVPGPATNGEGEAIATIAHKVDELLRRRIAEVGK